MIYKELNTIEIKLFESKILELLIDTYLINFKISLDEAETISQEKFKMLKLYIEDGSAIVVAAIKNKILIGFVWLYKHYHFSDKRLHVNQIAVDRQYRGRGIGKKLIIESENKAIELGICSIDLFVSNINEGALNLYNKLGFKVEKNYMKKNICINNND